MSNSDKIRIDCLLISKFHHLGCFDSLLDTQTKAKALIIGLTEILAS